MLRNTVLPVTLAMKTHSYSNLSGQMLDKRYQFGLKTLSNLKIRRLTFSQSYGFFKTDVMVDYKKNYYEILQVQQKAQLAEIKKSFYKLAKQSHPDTSKGNQELFKSINQAYNVLSHFQRRKVYDANRVRKEQNPNDFKAQAQRSSSYRPQQSTTTQPDNQNSQQYQNRKAQAYYHFNRGQWQQFRSGYKYHISPESEYFNSMTNNFSTDKIYETMKRSQAKQTEKDQKFLSEMEQYFAYVEKVRRKQQKDIDEYHVKLQEIEKRNKEERRDKFRKTLIGRGFTKVQNAFTRVSEALGKVLGRSTNTNQNPK